MVETFNVEVLEVDTNSLLTVIEDIEIEDPMKEDPISVEKNPVLILIEDPTSVE